MNKFHGFDVEWVIKSGLTLWKGCEIVATFNAVSIAVIKNIVATFP